MKKQRSLLLSCIALAVGLLCANFASGQSTQQLEDDGYFNVYMYMSASGNSISASVSNPEPDSYEDFYLYDVVGSPVWEVSGGDYHNSGQGSSFSSSSVPLGNSYTASFQFFIEFYYQSPYAGGEFDGGCEQYIDGQECRGTDNLVADLSLYLPAPPPMISNLSTYSVNQGEQGTLTITGSNFIENSSDQLILHFSGPSNPFTLNSAPSQCTSVCSATFSYDFSGYPPGTYNLWLENNEAQSEPVEFTVDANAVISQAPPVNSCAVTSSPQVNFTSIVPTVTSGGSGTINISFSGPTFATLPPIPTSIVYGPYSTPSSIASSIAALFTKYYFQYGLSAKAFGPNIVYNGNATIGTVNSVISGNGGVAPAFTSTTSTDAAAATEAACEDAPQTPLPSTEITIVGWINQNAIVLPSGEGIAIDAAFPSAGLPTFDPNVAATNPVLAALWAGCYTQLSILAAGKPGVAFTSSDKAYASAWLLKFSGNDDPGPQINPISFKSQVEKFRIFNSFHPGQTTKNTGVGNTIDPCGHVASAPGQQGLFDGQIGTTSHNYRYQLAEVRVDQAGQMGYKALNGKDIPYVWSVIEFDQNGYPVHVQNNDPTATYPTTNYQMFPTYSVYQNGRRIYVVPQGTPAAFANLPGGMQLLPNSIQ